jgi:Na+-translocating ferredoxin:NAD+ oxidoreductase subunit B
VTTATIFMLVLGVGLGAALGAAARYLPHRRDDLVERIDALLPQTQCAQCGYPGCLPYARAVARGEADMDLCPPGGPRLVADLARLLGREAQISGPGDVCATVPLLAIVDESRCIGCALCLPACPVDAIVGAPRHLHTVLRAECTGCELCMPACPVDCISMVPADDTLPPPPRPVAAALA